MDNQNPKYSTLTPEVAKAIMALSAITADMQRSIILLTNVMEEFITHYSMDDIKESCMNPEIAGPVEALFDSVKRPKKSKEK